MRPRTKIVAVLLPLLVLHCALVFDPDDLGPGPPLVASDAGNGADTNVETDAAIADAPSSDGLGPTGLDERIPLPDLDAAPCTHINAVDQACAFGVACRMATPYSGRCESCDNGRCAVNGGRDCTHSYDCDSIFTCFRGHCVTTCRIGSHDCGKRTEDCLDVGYHGLGLCSPSAQ